MKKLLALLLAMMMVFALAACGGNDTPDPSGSGTTGPGSSQQPQQSNNGNGEQQSGKACVLITDKEEWSEKNEFVWFTSSYTYYEYDASNVCTRHIAVYTFDTAEEAQKYINEEESNGTKGLKLVDTTVYWVLSDSSYIGTQLSELKNAYDALKYEYEISYEATDFIPTLD